MSTFWNPRSISLNRRITSAAPASTRSAAAYAFHIVADHPYLDGNKRTGALAAVEFLEANGVDTSRLPEQQTYESLIKVADHEMDRFELADLFRSALRPPRAG